MSSGPDAGEVGTGWVFGVHLSELYEAGRRHFPEMGERWYHAALQVDATASQLSGVRLPPSGEGFLRALQALVDEGQVALGSTSENLVDTGTALVALADSYAASDEAAAAQYQSILAHVPGLTDPPLAVPDPPRPEDRGRSRS